MEAKKISFGFMKTKKHEKPAVTEKKDYIDCMEEKSIKIIGGESVKEDVPLVIPMKPNTLVTAERLKEIAEKVESALDEPVTVKTESVIDETPPENETLEQMAARELLQEAKKEKVVEQPTLMVPLPAKPIMDGEKESTLDDYESVPIQEFGMAMLRGMGWTPGKEQSKYKQPQLRPKGLGLGADKVVTENQKKKASKEKDEELAIVKGSFVRVTLGKYNGCYGKVVSLDEDNGRVMIDIAKLNDTVSLSEFMMQAVTKSEFDKQSKVLNADSYTQYKKNEIEKNKNLREQNATSRESTSSYKTNEGDNVRERERKNIERYKEDREDDKYSNGKNKEKESRSVSNKSRHNSESDEEILHRNRRKDKRDYSSPDSVSSDSNRKGRRKKKHHSKTSSSDSSESDYRRKHKSKSSKSSRERRDIDKKRKGKKKRRDRDRSPNYRKHKK